ncbi:MAG: DUF3237 domain-containing protein [Betaproteobacteria bacterium]|nr:DUF3237 family protein [Pseudomonadota bacterium]NBO11650.1 DUF3237 domain-containing protein [Betaproteobacteria bacterium]NBO43409.1 DUF3237 domain-containing protein [Betaproteobacteria bacterium]NBP10110.1 DUF3237 domain-containing protein [Betaproteobacteria bacterium]NBP61231.1 DUF3237 domain-containing protein [Betaproteobacteria bacterium]
MIAMRHLFTLRAEVPRIEDFGQTPYGHRRIASVAGGHFQGDRLRGTIQPTPGGDWLLLRNDGVLMLDVRISLKTDDDQLIYMSYKGMRHGPTEVIERLNRGEAVEPSAYYFRSTPLFETASPQYQWLNKLMAVASGRRESTGPIYEVFELL